MGLFFILICLTGFLNIAESANIKNEKEANIVVQNYFKFNESHALTLRELLNTVIGKPSIHDDEDNLENVQKMKNPFSEILYDKNILEKKFSNAKTGNTNSNTLTQNHTCFNVSNYVEVFDVNQDKLEFEDFQKISPFLLYQLKSEACSIKKEEKSKTEPSTIEKYGYALLAVLILCLLAILGIFIFPFLNARAFRDAMSFAIGLATSSLFVDAVL